MLEQLHIWVTIVLSLFIYDILCPELILYNWCQSTTCYVRDPNIITSVPPGSQWERYPMAFCSRGLVTFWVHFKLNKAPQKLLQSLSHVRLCDPMDCSMPAPNKSVFSCNCFWIILSYDFDSISFLKIVTFYYTINRLIPHFSIYSITKNINEQNFSWLSDIIHAHTFSFFF